MAFGKKGEGAGLRCEEEQPFSKSEINALVTNILSYGIYIIINLFYLYIADEEDHDGKLSYAQFIDIVTECDEIDMETLRTRATKKPCCSSTFCDTSNTFTTDDDGEDLGLFIPPPSTN